MAKNKTAGKTTTGVVSNYKGFKGVKTSVGPKNPTIKKNINKQSKTK